MKLLISIFCILITIGCSSIVKTSDDKSKVGVRYALPLDRLTITVVRSEDHPDSINFLPAEIILSDGQSHLAIKSPEVKYQGIVEPTPNKQQIKDYFKSCYELPPVKTTGKISNISKVQTSDYSHHFSLRVEPQIFADSDITITRDSLGYLSNVTFNSEGKADDVLVGAAKIAGTVSGFALGGPAAGIVVSELTDLDVDEVTDDMKTYSSSRLQGDNGNKDAFHPKEVEKQEFTCKEFRKALIKARDLSHLENKMEDRFIDIALLSDFLDRAVFSESTLLKNSIESIDQDIISTTRKMVGEKDLVKLKESQTKIKIKKELKTVLENRKEFYAVLVEEAKNKVKKLYGIKKDSIKTDVVDVNISDLMATCYRDGSCNGTEVITPDKLEDSFPLKKIFNQAYIAVILSLSRPNAFKNLGTIPEDLKGKKIDDKALIAYRDTETFILTYFEGKPVISEDKTKIDSITWSPITQSTQQLTSSLSPIGLVPYDPSIFGKRDMSLTFNSGRLSTFKYITTSDASSLTDSLNNAAQGYIETIGKAQQARVDLQTVSRSSATAELDFNIDTLAKRKNLLENQRALDSLNSEEAAELAETIQDIELLEKRKELLEKQNEFVIAENTQQNVIDSAQHTSDLNTLLALQSIQGSQAAGESSAAMIAMLSMMSSVQQQLVDNPESEVLNSELSKLRIQVEILKKELEFRGLISSKSE